MKQFAGMLDGLAFLPQADLNAGLAHLHAIVPVGKFTIPFFLRQTKILH